MDDTEIGPDESWGWGVEDPIVEETSDWVGEAEAAPNPDPNHVPLIFAAPEPPAPWRNGTVGSRVAAFNRHLAERVTPPPESRAEQAAAFNEYLAGRTAPPPVTREAQASAFNQWLIERRKQA